MWGHISEALSGASGSAASDGTPTEEDLPGLQGLDDTTDTPSDLEPDTASASEDERGSDPMPDMAGHLLLLRSASPVVDPALVWPEPVFDAP